MPTLFKHPKKRKIHPCSNSSSKLYNIPEYRKLRETHIMRHPLCEMCLQDGIITPVQDVHHKRPFGWALNEEEQISLLLDPDNLISLCKKHHKEVHRQL